MSKHTPGPWLYAGESCGNPIITGGASGGRVCEVEGRVNVHGERTKHTADISRANGLLIAAAPELLAAAKFFAEFSGANGVAFRDDETVARHLAAIAKAEGK